MNPDDILSLTQPQIQPHDAHANLRLNGRLYFVVHRPFFVHFCRFSCYLSILICLTFDVLGYLWRFGVFKKSHYQAADHQGGEAPRGPVVLARVGPQILTKHHKFCAAPSAHVFNSSASMKQNPQLIFINRKGVRHLPSGVPPAPKPQQPGKTRVWRLTGFA